MYNYSTASCDALLLLNRLAAGALSASTIRLCLAHSLLTLETIVEQHLQPVSLRICGSIQVWVFGSYDVADVKVQRLFN